MRDPLEKLGWISNIFRFGPIGCLVFLICGVVFTLGIMAIGLSQGNPTTQTCNNGNCGFDPSKLAKYEECSAGTDPIDTVISTQGKEYATSIGVNEEDIKVWSQTETENLIRQEVSKQWPALLADDTHGSDQALAQRAILSYSYHEGGWAKFKGDLTPIRDPWPDGTYTFEPLSITPDKYKGCKNKQYAAAWDIRYDVYVGVKEILSYYVNNVSGEGEARWRNALGYAFLPSEPNRYWSDSRANVAEEGWTNYASEAPYTCPTISASACTAVVSDPKTEEEWIAIFKNAESITKVAWEFIAAIAFVETGIGSNLGTCSYFPPPPGGHVLTAGNGLRSAEDKIAFELHAEALSIEKNKGVSCQGKVGSGGAMGYTQVMPLEWAGQVPTVKNVVGHYPNPWSAQDAVIVTGFILKGKAGVPATATLPENLMRKAAARYYGCRNVDSCDYADRAMAKYEEIKATQTLP